MAKTDLIPLKIKIRYGKDPQTGRTAHLYPDFNSLPEALREGMDWSEFIDAHGTGWLYDQVAGHFDVDAESPENGVLIGCVAVPKAFADAANAAFDDVEVVDETELERFHDERVTVNRLDVRIDDQALRYVDELRRQGVPDTDERIAKIVDPDDPTPGLVKDKKKKWADKKVKEGLTIHATKSKK